MKAMGVRRPAGETANGGRAHAALGLLCVLLLASCATRAPRPASSHAAAAKAADAAVKETVDNTAGWASLARRSQWVRQRPTWAMQGRVAIRKGNKGGSGRIDWQQDGERYVVSLGAPVTRQSWRLSVGPEGARLEGLEGGVREGSDATLLLREATGWEIPVELLAGWARGVLSDEAPNESEGTSFSFVDHRLKSLRQDNWEVEYLAWLDESGQVPELPKRISASNGDASVRLVIDHWDFPGQ